MSFCGFLFTPVLVWIFTLIIPIHVLLRKLRACDKCNKCLSESKPMVEIVVFLSCATTPETKPPQERSPLWLEMASSFSGTWRPSSWRGSRFRDSEISGSAPDFFVNSLVFDVILIQFPTFSYYTIFFLLPTWKEHLMLQLKYCDIYLIIYLYPVDEMKTFTRIKSNMTKKSAETSALIPDDQFW